MSGCKEIVMTKDKSSHEDNCGFRMFKCPLGYVNCHWKGFQVEIITHVSSQHKRNVLYGPNHVLQVSLENPVQFNNGWIVAALGEIFFVNAILNVPHSQLFACVQYIGARRQVKDFMYTFTVTCDESDTNRKVTYCRTAHSDLDKLRNFYNINDCFVMKSDGLQHFATDGIVHLKLELSKISQEQQEN